MQLYHAEEVYIYLGYGATGGTNLGLLDILEVFSKTSAKPEFHSEGLKFA